MEEGVVRVLDNEETGLTNFAHLQNVWHYLMENGCWSYSPLHLASVFKVLIIEPEVVKQEEEDEEIDDYQKYNYTIYYTFCKKSERTPVKEEDIPKDSHTHEWFKDTVFHDSMEILGSPADCKGKLNEAYLCREYIECVASHDPDAFDVETVKKKLKK
jgi:hypothetical protein